MSEQSAEYDDNPRLVTVATPTDVPRSIQRTYPVQVTLYENDRTKHSWNLTEREARDLRDSLDRFFTPGQTPEGDPR